MAEKTKDKKSIAKANGLKSTFKLGESTYFMTSFGKGNEALPEKYITGSDVEDIRKTFTAKVKENQKQTTINGVTKIATDVQLPGVDNNLLQAKSTIEKLFFDKSFEDNIHIQIAYQIFDIKKLFSVYANSIVCAINNICNRKESNDWLGTFYTGNSYQKAKTAYLLNKIIDWNNSDLSRRSFLIKIDEWKKYQKNELKFISDKVNKLDCNGCFMSKLGKYLYNTYYADKKAQDNFKKTADSYNSFIELITKLKPKAYYFDSAFYNDKGEFDYERTYTLLRLCSVMRQSSAHEQDDTKAWLYNIDTYEDKAVAETIDKIVSTKVDSINKNFVNQNKVNLLILFNIFNEDNKIEIAKKYYDFAVRKSYKNIGFSLKTLRETLLTFKSFSFITESKYDSVRSKLYSLIDFVIYNYYIDNYEASLSNDDSSKIDKIVSSLRSTQNDDDKEQIYIENAKAVEKELGDIILKQIVPNVEENKIKENSKKTIDVNFDELSGYMENVSDISSFSKSIYCISLILDGKEINMFLNSLIEKFENIASFNAALEQQNIENTYNENYKLFEKSSEIARELTFLKSIAKMSKSKKATKTTSAKIKRVQYLDAAYLLGEYDKEKIEKLFGITNGAETNKAAKSKQKNDKKLHSLRNFIINNVINSNKFHYVVRFINPKDAQNIMKNEILVKLALKEINENQQTQIERYCKTIGIQYNEKSSINDLWTKIKSISLSFFKDVNNSKESVEKEQSKALIGLYMTILYYIVKKLVRINVSYFIAIGMLEKDEYILNCNGCKFNVKNTKTKDDTYDPCAISLYFKKQDLLNSRTKRFFDEGVSSAVFNKAGNKSYKSSNSMTFYKEDENGKWVYRWLFRCFRNNVEHITAVRSLAKYAQKINSNRINDFFDVYHYLMYCCIDYNLDLSKNDDYKNKPFLEFKASHPLIDEYQTVCKQFLYILCLPFAYNSARFYNLTSKEKFLKSYGK